jgi:pSer/pThr/pTyr-binding forkhead associated (FHA) protein
MPTDPRKELALKIARLAATSRLQDLLFFTQEGETQMGTNVLAVLQRLDPGTYLIGVGPYAQGIHLLVADETTLGRLPTPLEQSRDQAVDIFVNDAPSFLPREVSRVHAVIVRTDRKSPEEYWLLDRGSTCGTYVNGEKLVPSPAKDLDDVGRIGRKLNHADMISLGPSHVNVFILVDLKFN